MYLGGPVAPSCTLNKIKSSSSCLQLELVLFNYLCIVIPGPTGDLTRNRRAVPHSPMKILIDNGHGIQTKGKRSPDGKLLEYAYTRELARQIVSILKSRGYDSELLVPKDDDIPLSERVRRTNAHCQALGKSNVILISLHLNAAGDGTKWMNATGWSCYTCKGQTESDRLADCLYKAAEQILKNQVIRTDYARDGDPDWEENFYILRKSLCPTVLTENFFMDSLRDRDFLMSQIGKKGIVDTHIKGILNYISFFFAIPQ